MGSTVPGRAGPNHHADALSHAASPGDQLAVQGDPLALAAAGVQAHRTYRVDWIGTRDVSGHPEREADEDGVGAPGHVRRLQLVEPVPSGGGGVQPTVPVS
jgi:hypothetical protein